MDLIEGRRGPYRRRRWIQIEKERDIPVQLVEGEEHNWEKERDRTA